MSYHAVKIFFNPRFIWSWKVKAQLETPPDCFVQQFAVVGCRYHDHIAWQLIELHQEERNNPFYLTSFVRITPLFADCIELVKKEDTWPGAHIIKQFTESRICLTQIASDQRIVAHHEERKT